MPTASGHPRRLLPKWLRCFAVLALTSAAPARAQGLIDLPDVSPIEALPSAPQQPVPASTTATSAKSPASAAAPTAGGTAMTDETSSAKAPDDRFGAAVGVRSLVYLQDPYARSEFDDAGTSAEADVLVWGQVHTFLKFHARFAGVMGDPDRNGALLLDLAAKLELAEALNLWIGRMPVPSDRTSLSTVWFIAPWTLPGRYGSYSPFAALAARPAAGPRYGALGRQDGVTMWGQFRGGRFKYYLGAFGLDRPESRPLYSARLALSLLGVEPGFHGSSSYFGSQRILALGVGAQHQTKGSQPPSTSIAELDDYDALTADVLFEIGKDSAGVLDLEGSFAKLWGKNEIVSYQFFVLASYLVPLDVGFGRFQPLFRVQHASRGSAEDAANFTCIDAQLGYVVDGHRARLSAGYQYTRIDGQELNAVLFGLQMLSNAK